MPGIPASGSSGAHCAPLQGGRPWSAGAGRCPRPPEGAGRSSGRGGTDTGAAGRSKNDLGTDYGMGKISSIGKEWNEQAAAFSAYVAGKTLDEVAGIAVDESTKPAEADLAASVTISIGGFQALLEKLR